MADNKFAKSCFPPMLKMPEHFEEDNNWEAVYDTLQRNRKRWGLLEDYLDCLSRIIVSITSITNTCQCFRWIYQAQAVTDDTGLGAQANFVLPPQYELENNEYQLVFARTSFQYHNVGYTINVATNTITFAPGVLLGEFITIYALKHDDVQEVYYEQCAVPAVPCNFSPPVTVDRAPGRQLVIARSSFRFLDSGRPGDEYTVSNTNNTISLTSGLGPAGEYALFCRVRECGVVWHEEILATNPGQTVFTPANPGNQFNNHVTKKLIVAARTSFMHPGHDFITDPTANTLTLQGISLNTGQPLNVWVFN